MTVPVSLTEQLKQAALAAGADLIGVAGIDRFDGVAPQHHPASIFPETKSVVALAKRITRGCLRGVEEGTHFSGFSTYALNWVPNRFLAQTTVAVGTFLEDHRWEAVPIAFLPAETPTMGVPVAPGKPRPNVMVDLPAAAVRAGLGQLGWMGDLMTPQFGHLQQVQLVLTDAALDPDPLCATNPCDGCGACAQACPLGAIDAGQQTTVEVCGLVMSRVAIDPSICARCKNGAVANPYHAAGGMVRSAAACMRACTAHLDAAGRLERRFHNAFRQRPAWQIDRSGVPALAGAPPQEG
jgi:epoxyqueuosine reductase QueG